MIEINSYKMNAMICDSIEGDVGHSRGPTQPVSAYEISKSA